jgi:hypothetical protein
MISELYQKVLENELGRARYLLLLMIVGTLQILKQAKLALRYLLWFDRGA